LALAVKAGVRLPRVARASVRESFRADVARDRLPARLEPDLPVTAVPFPLRLPQAAADDFAGRVPLAEWPLEAWAPFPVAGFCAPELQRPFDEDLVPFVERAPADRESMGRRADRLLLDDDAGLRWRA